MKASLGLPLLVLAGATAVRAQVSDPHITSWLTANSAKYARVYETSADKTSGNAVATWPRSGLTNGGGGQATAAYSDVQRVVYSTNYVYIYTTGLPSYTMGYWLTPTGQTYTSWPTNRGAIHRIPRNPSIPTTKQKNNGSGGVLVNGVYVWQNGDAQSYTTSSGTVSMGGQGIWNRLAGVAEAFNFDSAYGHQPNNGAYHNHVNPIALRYQLGDNVTYNSSTKTYAEASTLTRHSPLIGWANDGLPIYGPYGYSSPLDATSGIRRMTSGFQKRNGTNGTVNLAVTGRTTLPVWAASVQGKSQTLAASEYGPSTTATYTVAPGLTGTYSLGMFAEDYEYLGDVGKTQGVDFDLNRQNVRYCVTPEFPGGTYAYFVCIDAAGATVFPDIINQEYFGSASPGQGTVTSINESVTEYVRAGPAAAIALTGTASNGNVALAWNSAEGATYKVESSANNATWTTLSSAVTSGGTTTNYTATTANYYRVTLTAIATYDTNGTSGTPVGTTASLTYTAPTVAPSITTQPSAASVTAGASATFTVVASGTAPLSYQWSKDGNTISGATAASYTIASTVVGDAGSYTCVVTNSAGSVTSNAATLTVAAAIVAPSITTQPASASIMAGASVTFTVAASGSGPLSYQWSKNGTVISGATSATYTIASTQVGDAGNYTCTVTNSAGATTSSAAVLAVSAPLVAPSITGQPASATVTTGGGATFVIVASGSGTLSYQWSKNGSAIAGATSATLSLTNVQSSDAASYTCLVTNSVGSVTSNAAILTVTASAVAPTLASQPASVTATVGESATFSVVANGTTPFTYQWRKDGNPISGATSASYVIAGVQAADAGSYACVITNSAGAITSNAAQLTVSAAATAPTIAVHPVSASVAIGAAATFTVVASGSGSLTYQWRKDGVNIAGATASTYSVANAQTSSSGSYTCVVTNSAGSVTSVAAILTVTAAGIAPTILNHPNSVTVAAGTSVTFSTAASGTGTLSYQWAKNSVPIAGATTANYVMNNVQSGDAGAYTCTVSNSVGSATTNIATLSLTVSFVPAVTASPASASVTTGNAATFSVTASGVGPFSYQWSKDGTAITGATSSGLTVANVQPASAGLYRAVIANAFTFTTSDAAILGVTTTSKVIGTGREVSPDVKHVNGNVYDQVLLEGAAAAVTTDSGQILRMSYVDLNNDIVQVEMFGPGTLSLVLDGASAPAAPVNYNQPDVAYVRGHAGIVIVGANETTNLSVFSVGRANAVNAALFRDGVAYDGWADIAYIAITSTDGKFGGLRTANASYFATKGITGVYAPGVQFTGPVYIGDVNAFDTAIPAIVIGSAAEVQINGGDLAQSNQRAVQVSGVSRLRFVNGGNSHGVEVAAQTNKARLEQNGIDITAQIVVSP